MAGVTSRVVGLLMARRGRLQCQEQQHMEMKAALELPLNGK